MKKLNKSILFVVLALVPLLFSRCTLTEDLTKLQSSLDSVKIIIGTPEFKSLVHFEFVDAKTKAYITDVAVVKVSGKNASAVYSNLGQKTSTYSSMMGMLDLVIDPHQVDTATILTNPLEFDVTTSLAGYINVTKKVVFNENKIQVVTIPLIKISDAPVGVSVSEKINFASSSATGALQATATETMNAGAQTIEIPKNVVLKDGAGNPVTGAVKSQIVFYNPTDSTAQAAIPGGLSVSAKQADGTTEDIQFVSAGMFGVSLTAGDKEVKTFENGGIRIKTKLDPAMINPNTNAPIKENDVIEMWSKNEGSGEWVFEKMDTVRKVGADLVLEETVKHLSSWNWDFFTDACTLGPKIIFKGNVSKVTGTISTNVYAWSFHKQEQFTAIPGDPNYGFIQMLRMPKNKPAIITFASTTPGVTFTPSTLSINNLCGGTYEVTINSTNTNTLTVMADLGLSSSSQPNLIIKPNATLMLRPTSGSTNWTINSVRNGIANLSITLGTNYDIYAAYGTSSAMGKLRVDNAPNNMLAVTYTPTVTSGSTATSVTLPPIPKPQNNTIVVKYNILLPDNVFNLLQ
jgi:hypothetical protein